MLRDLYVAATRSTRAAAGRTGLLPRLDQAYRRSPQSVPGHLRTLFAIHDVDDLVTLDTPWWTYPAIEVVRRHLEGLGGRARVLEYGSGASTVWLARRAGEVVSIEHHAGFARTMRRVLEQAGVADRVTLLEVPATRAEHPVTPSGRRGEGGADYTEYAAAAGRVGGVFDLVVVDGRARVQCAAAARPFLAPGGIVLFDDSQRPRYRAGVEGSGLPVRRLRGWVPSLPYPRETAVLGPARGLPAGR